MLPLVSRAEYADGTEGRTDGLMPDRYITLSGRRGQRENIKRFVQNERCKMLK